MTFRRLLTIGGIGLGSLVAACTTLPPPHSSAPPSGYTSLHAGLDYRQIITPAPNPRVTQVIAFDLSKGKLKLALTRGDTSGGKKYRSLTTSSYTRQSGALIGINAGFFGPVVDSQGVPMDAAGFVVADGVITSPALTAGQDSSVVNAVVCFDPRHVFIGDTRECPSHYREGLAAGPRLLRDGAIAVDPNNMTRHPRTALGVSASGKKVWLIVTDGRQAGYSEGATLADLALLFIELGAANAINLDGGGSSAIVYRGPNSEIRLLNRPIQSGVPGKERPVATHIGVFEVAR